MNIETIKIPLSEASMIKDLLQLTSAQVYEKYGFMSDDTIAHSVKFKDGTEAVVRLVIYDNEDKPFTECAFTECVLYDKYGFVIAYSEPKNIYEGEWNMVTDEGEYKINVVAVNYVNLIYKGLCDGSIEVMQGFNGDAVCVIGDDWFHMHCELNANASTSRSLRQMPGGCTPADAADLYRGSSLEIPVLPFQAPGNCPASGSGSDLRQMQSLFL